MDQNHGDYPMCAGKIDSDCGTPFRRANRPRTLVTGELVVTNTSALSRLFWDSANPKKEQHHENIRRSFKVL